MCRVCTVKSVYGLYMGHMLSICLSIDIVVYVYGGYVYLGFTYRVRRLYLRLKLLYVACSAFYGVVFLYDGCLKY